MLDEREVRSRVDALQKALSAREPAANVLNILKELQKGVKPSEELLRKTQVGKIVNKVKSLQSVDPAIPQLASEIVSQWRNQIKRASGSATPVSSTQNGSASPVPQAKATSSSTSSKSKDSTSELPTGVALDKRTHKTDNIRKGELTSEPQRNNSIGLLYDALVSGSPLPPAKVVAVAKAVEYAIISNKSSESSPSSAFYKEKIRALYQNLKNKDNAALRERVLSGEIPPEKFAIMTHDDLKSEKQKADEAKIEKENMNNAMIAKDIKSISNHLECGKCKQKMVSFTQAQTRRSVILCSANFLVIYCSRTC